MGTRPAVGVDEKRQRERAAQGGEWVTSAARQPVHDWQL